MTKNNAKMHKVDRQMKFGIYEFEIFHKLIDHFSYWIYLNLYYYCNSGRECAIELNEREREGGEDVEADLEVIQGFTRIPSSKKLH